MARVFRRSIFLSGTMIIMMNGFFEMKNFKVEHVYIYFKNNVSLFKLHFFESCS